MRGKRAREIRNLIGFKLGRKRTPQEHALKRIGGYIGQLRDTGDHDVRWSEDHGSMELDDHTKRLYRDLKRRYTRYEDNTSDRITRELISDLKGGNNE